MEMHPSVHLAWLIANREAAFANCACITPSHVLLGVLKILDDNFDREAEALDINAEELEQINEMVRLSRPLLQMSEAELTAARRGLHKALPDNNSGQTPSHVRTLPWSGDSLYLHQKALARAIHDGQRTVTLIHLLEELLENLPPEAFVFFQHHPRARTAVDSSEGIQSQAQYDSLLSAPPAEPDED
jgi:hypothetical protein